MLLQVLNDSESPSPSTPPVRRQAWPTQPKAQCRPGEGPQGKWGKVEGAGAGAGFTREEAVRFVGSDFCEQSGQRFLVAS